MRPLTVLITGAGRHSKEAVDMLKDNEDGIPVRVVITNIDDSKALRHRVDACHILPPITDPSYISMLLSVCKSEHVDVLLPFITSELDLVANNADVFRDAGTLVSVTSPKSLAVLNDKRELYKRYSPVMPHQESVSTVGQLDDVFRRAGSERLCCKVADRCGGAGFAIIDDEKALDVSLFNRVGVPRYISKAELRRIVDWGDVEIIVQAFADGIDYSVCVLAKDGVVADACGYYGYQMEFGAVVNGKIAYNRDAYDIAARVSEECRLDGNACFDFIVTDNRAYLLECNPRMNASLGFVWHAGCNMLWKRCKHLLGIETERSAIDYGLRMSKFYEAEYV